MKKHAVIITLTAALVWAGCAGHKGTATGSKPSPYERKPIREVSEEQLKLDNRLVDALTLQETGRSDEALAAYAALTHDEPQMAAAWY